MELEQKLELLKAEYIEHGAKYMFKADSKLWRVLQAIVKVLTFGKVPNFLNNFSTTLGHTVYLKDGIEGINLYSHLVHELVHVKQAEKYSTPLFMLLYVLAPLPIGLAWFRWKFEREAYLEGGKAYLEFLPELDKSLYADHVAENLGGVNYLFAWPFKKKIRAWILSNLG
jgi:hypothetical protein